MSENVNNEKTGGYSRTKVYLAALAQGLLANLSTAAVGTVSIVLLYFADFDGKPVIRILSCVIVGLFWLSIIVQILSAFAGGKFRKMIVAQNRKTAKNDVSEDHRNIGLISFFTSKEGLISDIVFFVSFAAMVAIIVFRVPWGWLTLLCAAILYLAFSLHCIFNGKNYRFWKELTSKRSKNNG